MPVRRRLLTGLLAVGMATAGILAPSGAAAVAVTNPVIANAGFEAPVVDGVIPGWKQTFGSTPAFTVVDAPAHSGAHSVRMTDTSTTESDGLQSDNFAVSAGESYRFTAAVNIHSGLPMLYAYFYNSAGTQLDSASVSIRGTQDTWVTAALSASAPAGATQAAILLYSAVGGTTTAYFDDVMAVPAPGTVTDLGTPIHNVAANSAAYATTPDGTEVAYLGLNGDPAVVAELNTHTGKEIAQTTLPGAAGVWALATAPDGSVYAGSYSNGTLYHWTPWQGNAVSLGAPLTGESYIWDLTVDDQGTLYGGTFPSGKVFAYDPSTGKVRDYGQIAPDSQYARSLAWLRGRIYVGLGTQVAHLVELDPVTGKTREISLPGQAASASMVYDLDAYQHYVIARTSDPTDTVVYDTSSDKWVADLGDGNAGLGVSSPAPSNDIYYINNGTLTSYNLRTGKITPTGFTGLFSARSFGWIHLDTTNIRATRS